MARNFSNLLEMDFVPLTEIKAKLSEFVRRMVARSHRLTITTNGRPTAVLMPYSDFLELLQQRTTPAAKEPEKIVDIKDWRRGKAKRAEISRYIDSLFNPGQLAGKGQKAYKRERVRDFDR